MGHSELRGHSKILTCCSGECNNKGWEALTQINTFFCLKEIGFKNNDLLNKKILHKHLPIYE